MRRWIIYWTVSAIALLWTKHFDPSGLTVVVLACVGAGVWMEWRHERQETAAGLTVGVGVYFPSTPMPAVSFRWGDAT